MKQRDIKQYVYNGLAIDLTTKSGDYIKKLREQEKGFNTVDVSTGLYGINGCLVQGNKTKQLYAVTTRNTNIYGVL